MIVVFDSGIWISALQFGGIPLRPVEHAFLWNQLVFCDQILSEVRTILMRKFLWLDEEVQELLTDYLSEAVRADVAGKLRGVSRDPKDDMVFKCAVASHANVIVSGDQDLLTVDLYQGIQVITARQYLQRAGAILS